MILIKLSALSKLIVKKRQGKFGPRSALAAKVKPVRKQKVRGCRLRQFLLQRNRQQHLQAGWHRLPRSQVVLLRLVPPQLHLPQQILQPRRVVVHHYVGPASPTPFSGALAHASLISPAA